MRLHLHALGITARLILVATVPAALMFVVMTAALYMDSESTLAAALASRGEFVATAIAETSQYGVISGNAQYLETNARRLLKADRSVSMIEVLDRDRHVLVSLGNAPHGSRTFEAQIREEVADVEVFDSRTAPHVSRDSTGDARTSFRPGRAIGYVRVAMSSASFRAEQLRRFELAAVIVLITTVSSGVVGLWLAQRLRMPLTQIANAVRAIKQGRLDVALPDDGAGELGELQVAIADMAIALQSSQRDLENQVATRTGELQRALDQISRADAERRSLLARTTEMLENERQRISVEIHDQLNAALIVVQLKIRHIASIAGQMPVSENAREIERTAEDVAATTGDLYTAARSLVKALRPEVLDTLGLRGAVQEMIHDYDRLHPDCSFRLHVNEGFPDLRGNLGITAYRIVQEALSNIVKHAEASRADVRLRAEVVSRLVRIEVVDNGIGFDPVAHHAGLGLVGMRERMASCGGSVAIESALGEGTKIVVELPWS